jgi:hypothetical protein
MSTLEYFDSQSGQHVSFPQGVQRHAVFRSRNNFTTTNPRTSTFATMQLGDTTSAFEKILFQLGESVGPQLRLFAPVHSAADIDKVKLLNPLVRGVTVNVNKSTSFSVVGDLITRARSQKLECRCNLVDCFDFQDSSQTHKNALKLATLVGDLTDIDVSVMILHLDAHASCDKNEENTHEALQAITDEVYGLDCVGPPLRARFGIYSSNEGLCEWATQELDVRNRLELYD